MKRFDVNIKKAVLLPVFFAAAVFFCACEIHEAATDDISAYIPVTTTAETTAETETETETETDIPVIVICGKEFSPDAEKIVFSGGEITDLSEITGGLNGFKNLKSVDLGSFEISVAEAEALMAGFDGVAFKYNAYVPLYGRRVSVSETEIDLSGIDISDTSELFDALHSLPDVVRVVSTDGQTKYENKKALKDEYPGIEFDFAAVCDLYGRSVMDSAVRLDLKGVAVDDGLTELLKMFSHLETVDLRLTDISFDLQKQLKTAYPAVNFIWTVNILGRPYASDTEDIDLSGGEGLTAGFVRDLMMLFSNLKRVDLSDCGLQNEELAELRTKFPDTKVVWKLYMGKWSLKTDAVAFSVLIYDYNYTRLTSEDIEVLKYCTDLQALDLGHQAITDISVIGEYLKELRILILVDNKLSDITPLSNLTHLHYLELFVNRQLKDISPLGACRELVDLNVSYLYDLRDISALYDLPLLERVWIEHTDASAASIKRLKESHPDATVIDVGEGSVDQGWREHKRYKAMFDMFKKTDYMSDEFSKYDFAAS